jgi:hypothetical protein
MGIGGWLEKNRVFIADFRWSHAMTVDEDYGTAAAAVDCLSII